MLNKTEGIILRQQTIADNKKIVNVFTQAEGKKTFVIYNTSNKKKKNVNIFQPFFLINIEFNDSYKKNFLHLKYAEISYPLMSIPNNPHKTALVFFLTEIMENILENNFSDSELFLFLKKAIILLDKTEHFANFHLAFLSEMALYLGIMPNTNYSQTNKFFDIRKGIFSPLFDKNYSMNDILSKKFYELITVDIINNSNVKLSKNERKLLVRKILNYYSFHFDKLTNLKSLDILEQIYS